MQRQANPLLTLHTALFTLHTCTSHLHFALDTSSHLKPCELFSPHLSYSHLIPSLLTCHLSKFFSTVFISSQHWPTILISLKFVSTHVSCSARQKALTVRQKSLTQETLGTESFCTQTLETQMHINTKAFPKYFVLQSLHKALPSTTFVLQSLHNYFPVLLCTTKLAKSTSFRTITYFWGQLSQPLRSKKMK